MKQKILLLIATIFASAFIFAGCRVEITALYDAVIFGSGLSSITTALDLDAQGKRVLIVEPSGIIGGNKRLISDGISYLDEANGDTAEKFITDIEQNNSSVNFFTNTMVTESMKIPEWLSRYEIELDKLIKLPGHQLARTLVSQRGLHTGQEVINKLDAAIKRSKIDMNYNSTISRITPERNNIYHVTIEQNNTVIAVNTKTLVFGEDNVIAYDAIAPVLNANELRTTNFSGQIPTSPGMELLRSLEADISNGGNLNFIDTYNMASAQKISPILRSYGALLVNKDGKRFVNEMGSMPQIIEAILKQKDETAYLIYDDTINNQLIFLNDYYKDNTLFQTPSLNVLAHDLEINEDDLRATIANYHQMIVGRNDTAFQRSFEVEAGTFEGITKGTGMYFAIQIRPVSTVFSSYAEITDRFEVMRRGIALPGIYAIGDSAKDVRLNSMLHGTEMTLNIVMGNVASKHIIEYLAQHDAT